MTETTATTTLAAAPVGQSRVGPAARAGRALYGEWTKLCTVRSTVWALLVLVGLDLGLTALIMWLDNSRWEQIIPDRRQQIVADPVFTVLNSGLQLSQLAICVLGALVITSEYSTGAIRSSLLAIPGRGRLLAAKCAVFAAVVFVVAEIGMFGSFFLGARLLHSKVDVSLADENVLRAVVGAGLYAALLGLFSVAVGALIRHTAGAIATVIGLVLVISPLTQLLPGSLGDDVHAYLPTVAGALITQAHRHTSDLLGPWQGLGVFCLWTAVLLAAAAVWFRRRDA